MVVGIDLRCLPSDGSEGAGVAHAARSLCSHLIEDRTIEWIAYVPKDAASVIPAKAGIQNPMDPRIRKDDRFTKVELADRSSKSLRRAIKENPCDLLFVPSGAVSLGIDIPAVPWVHDLIIFDHPEWFNQGWLQKTLTTWLFLRGIKRAPLVFAVSEYTKQAAIKYAKIPAKKIIVTYEGGDEELTINNEQLTIRKQRSREYCSKKFGINRPFVLALGTVEPRKNLAMLIRAWALTPGPSPIRLSSRPKPTEQERGVDLVIAGQDGWKMEEVEREISKLDADQKNRFHRIRKISDDEKRNLLSAAQIVAVPSLDEGFGLVALEALQAGTDVIASKRGALPEVVGEAGLLLDPMDEKAWAQALTSSTEPEEGTREVQIEKFSWEKTAKVILEGLKGLDKKPKKN